MALGSQASRQQVYVNDYLPPQLVSTLLEQEQVICLTAMGMCVSRREEDKAMLQLLGGCKQWRLTWLNIIASHLDHQGFVDLVNILENGRCAIGSP